MARFSCTDAVGKPRKGGRHLPQKKYPLLTEQRERKKKESLRSIDKNLRVLCLHFACTPAHLPPDCLNAPSATAMGSPK
jgi:hypothetical protein